MDAARWSPVFIKRLFFRIGPIEGVHGYQRRSGDDCAKTLNNGRVLANQSLAAGLGPVAGQLLDAQRSVSELDRLFDAAATGLLKPEIDCFWFHKLAERRKELGAQAFCSDLLIAE